MAQEKHEVSTVSPLSSSRVGFSLTEIAREGAARACKFSTPHGEIATPCFMPVGTQASLKGVLPSQAASSGAKMILANTYHLLLRPGLEVLRGCGGVRSFMRWDGALLTDSGGFQAMSLGNLVVVEDDGIAFRSHIDGSALLLTPELAMEAQIAFDSTIAMMLDECITPLAPNASLRAAMERSLRWGARCQRYWSEHALAERALFGIVQGGLDLALRREALERTCALDFSGYALGGLAIGESAHSRNALLYEIAPLMPRDKARYLMGVGKPRDLCEAIACGIDLFDCVLPTRSGRTGQAFCFASGDGMIARTRNLRNARYTSDYAPLEMDCPCPSCAGGFSRAYLHHLFRAGEMLGAQLLSVHNIFFYQRFMAHAREMIVGGGFGRWLAAMRASDG